MTEPTGRPTDSDVHTLTGAYAADALPDLERANFERHLLECDACVEEVAELLATTALLARAVAAPAPAAMRARVLAEVATVRQLPARGNVGGAANSDDADDADDATSWPPGASWSRAAPPAWWRQPLGIAASILAIVALGLGVATVQAQRRADDARVQAARISAIATDPDRFIADGPVTGGGTATIVSAGGRALFSARGLRPLPDQKTYQLWVIDKRGPRSAGVLGRGPAGSVDRFVPDVRRGEQLAVTVEPAGGSTKPSTRPIAVLPPLA